ncbi:hypothetical protein [Sphingomonas bacterium]|uniref:hypothetical protein n=1 Tax=Sphingomonas bacterium TaxID=1895847 RepID=UPI0026162921|nr:hypothetical protein [Sphingomonas bacterium]MDB5679055.1 hypothetical protein [Sphingomonas bacterium]
MQPPPSRYRVVERGGRLVVLDSAVGGAPLTARDLLPDMASESRTDDTPPMVLDEPYMDEQPLAEPVAPVAPPPSRYATAQSMIAEPPGALRSVAETVAGGARDGDGRLLLTTARWYDAKGPRTLALGMAAEQQLGGAVLALVAAAIVAVFLAVMGDVIGWMIVFGALFLLSRAKPVATLWIDRLATQ